MTAGVTPRQGDLWRGTAALCEGRVGASRFGAAVPRGRPAVRRRAVRRPVAQVGRRSVPPRVVATVMCCNGCWACRTAKRSRHSASTHAGSTPAATGIGPPVTWTACRGSWCFATDGDSAVLASRAMSADLARQRSVPCRSAACSASRSGMPRCLPGVLRHRSYAGPCSARRRIGPARSSRSSQGMHSCHHVAPASPSDPNKSWVAPVPAGLMPLTTRSNGL